MTKLAVGLGLTSAILIAAGSFTRNQDVAGVGGVFLVFCLLFWWLGSKKS